MISSKEIALNASKNIIRMVYESQCSHVGSALSCIDIISVLYSDIMKHDPLNPKDENRDRFILSKGHACTSVYSVLAEFNYFDWALLNTYAKENSILMSHISSKVPGVEFSTGSLGHGLPVSVGIAFALKKKNMNNKVFVLMSDGELNEGSNFEAIMLASKLKLDNLIAIVDCNKLQAMGYTKDIIDLEPIEDKFKVFNWDSMRIDGHNHEFLKNSLLETSKQNNGKPKVIVADTIKGKGITFMENKLEWHYKSPNESEYIAAINELEKCK